MPVVITTKKARSIRDLQARAERMLAALRMKDAELSILVCDDRTIHELNRTWRGKDAPTDVLAFAMAEGEPGGRSEVLGDVVISIDTARRQARERARTISDEVTFLLAHGLLHLLGYDHQTDAEERRMNARTDLLCAAANAPPRGKRRSDRVSRSKKATKKRR